MKQYFPALLSGIGAILLIFSPLLDNIGAFFAVDALGEALCHRGTDQADSK